MIQQKWLHLQTKIAQDDYLKIALRCGTYGSFDSERSNSIKRNFYDRGNEQIFWCWVGYFLIPVFSNKVEQSTPGEVQQFCHIFGNKWDAWHTILGDNPAGHDFALRDLVLIELFQISNNCVTGCTHTQKFLLKFS